MRLASYDKDHRPALGAVVDGNIVPLDTVARSHGLNSMTDLIEQWAALEGEIRACIETSNERESLEALDRDRRWRAPVKPQKILALVANDTALSSKASFISDHPVFFSYPPSALTGHLQPIEMRASYGLTHPEPELGVVIGRRTKNISSGEAMSGVFGYTIVDDVTSPDLKAGDTVIFPLSSAEGLGGGVGREGGRPAGYEHGDYTITYHARSKGTDTFAPCGPWIVTRDEIADPHGLQFTLALNGEVVSEGNTANLRQKIPDVIAFASKYFTLEPGDLIHIGTAVGKVAPGTITLRDISYQNVDGERTIEFEGVGRLTNFVAHLPE